MPAEAAYSAAHIALWLKLGWTYVGQPSPLAVAIMAPGSGASLSELLKGGLPAARDEPWLSLAVENPAALKTLIAAHADANAVNSFGKTALMTAAQFNQATTIALLLQAGARINAETLPPTTLPFNVSDPNQTACGPTHITHGLRTALMYAAANADLPVIKQLLAAGADITLRDSMNNTALDYLLGIGPVPPNPLLKGAARDEAVRLLSGK